MPVGALIGGGLGALGAVGGSLIQSNAATTASAQQVAAQQQALQMQQGNFDSALDFQKSALASALGVQQGAYGNALDFQKSAFGTAQSALNPFITAGTNVLPTLSSLLTPGPSQTATLSQLPGFQFQSQYGTQAATNALTARGLGGSTGALARGISDYNSGLAGTSFNNLVSSLMGYAGLGSSAAGALGSAAGTAGSNVGTLASNFGSNVGNISGSVSNAVGNLTGNFNNAVGTTLTNTGNAAAAGTLGSANALASGLTGGTTSATNALLLSKLLPGAGGGGGGIYGSVAQPNPFGGVSNPTYS